MSDTFTQKSQKIASAIYLITSFFDSKEPIKWKLRALALELVSLTVSIKDSLLRDKISLIDIDKIINGLESILLIAKNAGLISQVNYELMFEELAKYPEQISQTTNVSSILGHSELPKLNVGSEKWGPVLKDENKPKEMSLKDFGIVFVKKNTRQSAIISIFKRKKEVMIKDIVAVISGYSEKTIQRELSAMVGNGVLKKTGEKRWSRYSLA